MKSRAGLWMVVFSVLSGAVLGVVQVGSADPYPLKGQARVHGHEQRVEFHYVCRGELAEIRPSEFSPHNPERNQALIKRGNELCSMPELLETEDGGVVASAVDCGEKTRKVLTATAIQPRFNSEGRDMCSDITQAQARLFYCSNLANHPTSSQAKFAGLLAVKIADFGVALDKMGELPEAEQENLCEKGELPLITQMHADMDGVLWDLEILQTIDASKELVSLKDSIERFKEMKSCSDLLIGAHGVRGIFKRPLLNWMTRVVEREVSGISKDTTQGGMLPPAILNSCASDEQPKTQGR